MTPALLVLFLIILLLVWRVETNHVNRLAQEDAEDDQRLADELEELTWEWPT